MMEENSLHSDFHRRFTSKVKSITINLGNFQYNHKDNPEKHDLYIHREQLERKLESWLLSRNESGSYLVTGYRGMGKSSLVNHVLDRIVRSLNPKIERIWNLSVIFMALTFYCGFMGCWIVSALSFISFVISVIFVISNHNYPLLKFNNDIKAFRQNNSLDIKKRLGKLLSAKDITRQSYKRIKIKINLGKEIMNERDVLCLITSHIKNKYEEYLNAGHNKPLWMCFRHICAFSISTLVLKIILIPLGQSINGYSCCIYAVGRFFRKTYAIIGDRYCTRATVILIAFLGLTWLAYKLINRIISLFDKSQQCLKKLTDLSDRLSSSISESDGNIPNLTNSIFNISLFGRRNREIPSADIRDIEAELIDIINTIKSRSCISVNRVQFFIVLDELDKAEHKDNLASSIQDSELTPPEFSSSIDGFTEGNSNTERRKVVLQMLGNMKLFLTTAKAKFIFISGRELYDAFLADISDREYAISSIFSGVLNVSSFLYPEREQSDISSLTEQYVAETLLPEKYLWKKSQENAQKNGVIKKEIPSLRWYIQYLTELAIKERLSNEELKFRKEEIRHITIFLKNFIVYLSHVSNGAPKKIVLYFEKYIKRQEDLVTYYDWPDNIECGVRNKYALYFTPEDQQKIGFISYLAAPIMDVITNNVSNYDDKLLVEASFLIDHLFKFHGRGFSWRNIELTPELLDVNKTPELRDFITSIMEFMQQLHISSILVGLFQFKFRKRISEELSYISRVSDEAAAMFNFTLNESHPVKQYYAKLLNYYLNISHKSDPSGTNNMYGDVISRIHISLANLYFMEENYSRALQEYRCALNYLDRVIKPDSQESLSSIITRVRCMLKMGLTCEYSKNYETAYVIYCNLVDTVIAVREVEEKQIGLDLLDRWVDDWRIKQPMLVDPGVKSNRFPYNYTWNTSGDKYMHYVYNLVWDDSCLYSKDKDNHKLTNPRYGSSQYSLDFEHLISGFSKNLSPEKSHFIAKLSLFEDVRLIYKAILAKLFIIEKMNMSGITQSNIEIAEAEFKYLHRTINLKEKFFISADFFYELGKILYYKNNLNLIANNKKERGIDTLRSALYWWNIDLYAYMDEFCFCVHDAKSLNLTCNDSTIIKDTIIQFFDQFTIDSIKTNRTGKVELETIFDDVICSSELAQLEPYKQEIIEKYLKYVTSIKFVQLQSAKGEFSWKKINDCCKSRSAHKEKSWNIPCHACKYINQSLKILIDNMFVNVDTNVLEANLNTGSKSVFLLRYSFRKYIRYLRVNHLRLLASNAVGMGNVLYSCSRDNRFSGAIIELIYKMLLNRKDGDKQKTIDDATKQISAIEEKITKIDKALLYYLAAYRYYNIANQHKDAADCLIKILRVVNEVITNINFHKKGHTTYSDALCEIIKCNRLYHISKSFKSPDPEDLLDVLFVRISKCVTAQYGYSPISEMYDYRWLLHMNSNEDIDLRRLSTYTELKETVWLIYDTKIKVLNLKSFYENINNEFKANMLTKQSKRDCIFSAYRHFNVLGQTHSTFYNDVFSNYARFRLTKWIFKDILGQDPMVMKSDSYKYNKDYAIRFIELLQSYLLEKNLCPERLDSRIFHVANDSTQKLRLIEFILEDAIVCLTEILYTLTPYNHISSFTNSFVAEVYAQLWEYSKMYETLDLLYDYIEKKRNSYDIIFEKWIDIHPTNNYFNLKQTLEEFCSKVSVNDEKLKRKYGNLKSQFFTRLRHNIDDRTLHHVISNYAAEMALRYYALSESNHSEGESYKNNINRNYILNDDLGNDTWFFNTAVERYRLHMNYIQEHKRRMSGIIKNSRFHSLSSYSDGVFNEQSLSELFDKDRFDDSLNINSEL